MAYSSQLKLELTSLMNQIKNTIVDNYKSDLKDITIKQDMDRQDNNVLINKVNNYIDQIKSDLQNVINDKSAINNQNLDKLNEHTALNFTELNKK